MTPATIPAAPRPRPDSAPLRPSPATPADARRPVLLALEPYDRSDAAVAMAQRLAASQGRELYALAALEPGAAIVRTSLVPLPLAELVAEERSAVADELERRLSGARAYPSLVQRVDVVPGPAARAIVDAAQERQAHVIVVGTGRHDAADPRSYAERAAQVTHLTDRPVLVVPPGIAPEAPTRAIVAVDFSPASQRAARFALDLIGDGGSLTLVHVKSAVTLQEESAGWWDDAYRARTAELFARFTAALPPSRGITISATTLYGDVAPTLLAFAREHHAGLIATGARRRSVLGRLFAGSVSTELLRRAGCPVAIVPALRSDADGLGDPVGGVVESWDAAAWPVLIDRFRERNGGRAVHLRFKAASPRGAGSSERGYRLVDVRFDPAAARAEIVLGDPDDVSTHLAHRISNVRSVMVCTDAMGQDSALRLDTAGGRCTLSVGDER